MNPNAQQQLAWAAQIRKEVQNQTRTYDIEASLLAKDGLFLADMRFAGRDKIILAKRVLQLGDKIVKLGEFEAPPGAADASGRRLSPAERAIARAISNIFAASVDGKWASSGTHIYNVATLKPVKRLPFVSVVQAFSADGRSLYLYDRGRKSIYFLEDWEKSAGDLNPPPPTGPGGKELH
jgi:hypothetical protein